MLLVRSKLYKCTQLACSDERYVAIVVDNLLLINVYFPCVGTPNRLLVYEEILRKISLCVEQLSGVTILLGGDFNADLNESSPTSNLLNQFALDNGLVRYDNVFTGSYLSTCCNESLMCHSNIDFFLISVPNIITEFSVTDPCINFPDHRPVNINCSCNIDLASFCEES